MEISGSALLEDKIITDLKITGEKINLNELQKYVPGKLFEEIGIKKVSGIIDFETYVKGVVADSIMPNIELNIEMQKGTLLISEYPVINNISFKGVRARLYTSELSIEYYTDKKEGEVALRVAVDVNAGLKAGKTYDLMKHGTVSRDEGGRAWR